ncbi:MAG: hypothetical protein ACLGI2_01055 [Acidimicrobiia bacterium]
MDREGEGTRRLALGLVLAVLVTVGGGIVLSRWADRGALPQTVGATGQPGARTAASTTTAPADPATTTTEAAAGPAPSTTAPTPSATTRATGATASTTAPPGPETTTTTSAGADEAAADGPPGPACNSTMFDTRLSLDRTTFRPGETVRGTATFTNVSGNTCYWASTTGKVEVLDSSGRSVGPLPAVIRDGFHWVPFTPGEVFTQHPSWNQEACPPGGLPMPCGQAPPGTYTMVVTEEPYGVARATFGLVAG